MFIIANYQSHEVMTSTSSNKETTGIPKALTGCHILIPPSNITEHFLKILHIQTGDNGLAPCYGRFLLYTYNILPSPAAELITGILFLLSVQCPRRTADGSKRFPLVLVLLHCRPCQFFVCQHFLRTSPCLF